jgi:hypothetical protein
VQVTAAGAVIEETASAQMPGSHVYRKSRSRS